MESLRSGAAPDLPGRLSLRFLLLMGAGLLLLCVVQVLRAQFPDGLQAAIAVDGSRFAAPAADRERRAGLGYSEETVEGPRGRIVDRAGRTLAGSVLCYDIVVEIEANEDFPAALARDVCAALRHDRSLTLEQTRRIEGLFRVPRSAKARFDRWASLRADGKKVRGFRFIWNRVVAKGIASRRSLDRLHRIGKKRYRLPNGKDAQGHPLWRRPGIFRLRFERRWRRYYPLGESAGHLIGLPPRYEKGKRVGDSFGLESLSILDARSRVKRTYRRSAHGSRYVVDAAGAGSIEDLACSEIETTIDAGIQDAAHGMLARQVESSGADRGTLFVADLATGDLLALCGYPSYDPGDPRPHAGQKSLPLFPVTHHARFVPGSVIKPLLIMLALQRGVVRPWDRIDCRGNLTDKAWSIGGVSDHRGTRSYRVIRDDHPVGDVELEQVLVQSSNIGAVKIGRRMGREILQELLPVYRLSAAPELGLPQATYPSGNPIPGSFPAAKYFTDRHYFARDAGPSISFGYQLNLYPLTFGEAMASVITGKRFRFRLLRSLRVPGKGELPCPRAGAGKRLFDEEHSRFMIEAMAKVVTDPKGTGRGICDDRTRGWLGGKTGTSYLENRKTGKRRYYASFVGFAPVERPRWIAMAVLEKHPARSFYGGRFAAPVVKDLLLYLWEHQGEGTLRAAAASDPVPENGVRAGDPRRSRGGR